MQRKASRRTLWVFGFFFLPSAARLAQTGQIAEPKLAPDLRSDIDRITQEVLVSTGVPSASIAIVQDGKIASGSATCPTARSSNTRSWQPISATV